jgi:hypothetical protein
MGRLNRSLLILYLTIAAGYGGWRGGDVWSGWGIWCLLLPPLAWAVPKAVGDWHRNPSWLFVKIGLATCVVAVVAIGGQGLILAWVIAEATEKFSAVPAVRAGIGAALAAAGGGLIWLYAKSQRAAERRQATVVESTGGPAEPGAAADGGA